MNIMNVKLTVTLSIAVLLTMFTLGCDLGGSSSSSDKTYAGEWAGLVCGRNLKMTINQDGNNLSGTYSLDNPDFQETFQGTVDGSPSAAAVLTARGGRKFEITFSSYNRFEGTFFNPGPVCSVSAAK